MALDIPTLINAAGGEIVGKVRLQKLVYLLDQIGVESDLSFAYHHYGPYSEELADRVEDDLIFRRVNAETRRRADGVPFVVYRAIDQAENQETTASLGTPRVRAALAAMQRCSATVLELAATIHWLAAVEELQDWRAELVRRKGVKTEHGRTDAALRLLEELQITPA